MSLKSEAIARFRESDKKTQSLKEHIYSVVAGCGKAGQKIGLKYIAEIIAYVHDMGKYQEAFQSYIKAKMNKMDADSMLSIDHGIIGAKLIFDSFHTDDSLHKATAEIISMIVAYHHGGMSDFLSCELTIPLIERLNKVEAINGLSEVRELFFTEIISFKDLSTIFLYATQEIDEKMRMFKKYNIDAYFGLTLLMKMLYSCLIDADRLDACMFENMNTAIKYTDWDILQNELDTYISRLNEKNQANKTVCKLRKYISDQCKNFALREGGVYTLSVPTGGGKTLSSFRYAIEHAKHFKDKQRVFYIIPYITILEQNAEELRKSINNMAYVLEYHSNITIDSNYSLNIKLAENWDAQIILTSMVQFFNSFYSKSTQDTRRLHNLTNSIKIIDEVQTIPTRCINLFNSVINFLAYICNTTVILCTATQPALDITKRPLLKLATSEIIPDQKDIFNAFKRVDIIYKKDIFTSEDLADFAVDMLDINRSILIILNTKKSVERVCKSLAKYQSDSLSIIYLSTYMCPAHRTEVINKFRELLAKKKKVICVSTQLIEAGVDISADCVIRSLAGIDSIAQAAGRCNRHGEYATKNVYVIRLADSDEDVSKLPDIRDAQNAAINVLERFSRDPMKYEKSLLSPGAIQEYFESLYCEKSKEMDYFVKKYDTTIYNLLSTNSSYRKAYESKYGKGKYNLILAQAILTAGEEFYVIDKNTTTVIVPYKKGKIIIADLNSSSNDIVKKKQLLREAQKFSVSLYTQDVLALGAGIYEIGGGIAYALNETFYSNNTGVITEGGIMDLVTV